MSELEEYRQEIDQIDESLVKLFEKRMDLSKKISRYKAEHGLPILNETREAEVINKSVSHLKNKDYMPFTASFFKKIMELSRECQEKQS